MANPLSDKTEDEIVLGLFSSSVFVPDTPIAQVQAEMQRRLIVAIPEFNAKASEQTARLITLAEETSDQTDKVICLTWVIAVLTVAIAILTGVMVWNG